jgi:hypothetical protein
MKGIQCANGERSGFDPTRLTQESEAVKRIDDSEW